MKGWTWCLHGVTLPITGNLDILGKWLWPLPIPVKMPLLPVRDAAAGSKEKPAQCPGSVTFLVRFPRAEREQLSSSLPACQVSTPFVGTCSCWGWEGKAGSSSTLPSLELSHMNLHKYLLCRWCGVHVGPSPSPCPYRVFLSLVFFLSCVFLSLWLPRCCLQQLKINSH